MSVVSPALLRYLAAQPLESAVPDRFLEALEVALLDELAVRVSSARGAGVGRRVVRLRLTSAGRDLLRRVRV